MAGHGRPRCRGVEWCSAACERVDAGPSEKGTTTCSPQPRRYLQYAVTDAHASLVSGLVSPQAFPASGILGEASLPYDDPGTVSFIPCSLSTRPSSQPFPFFPLNLRAPSGDTSVALSITQFRRWDLIR